MTHSLSSMCESHYGGKQFTYLVHALPYRVIRAPLPWHNQMQQLAELQKKQLFTTNKIQAEINQLWHSKCVCPNQLVPL